MNKADTALGTGGRVKADGGRSLLLGKLVKSGGAGGVYLLPDASGQVAKIYHPQTDLRLYERKIQAMLTLAPKLPELTDGGKRIIQMAWPEGLLRDPRGRFCGFLMPRLQLDETIELEYILQERQARAENLPVGLGARMTLAANVSALVAELHRYKHYIVDLKPVNVRLYRRSLRLAMLDCDGFSIYSERERFPAPQYTPDYLAPEFHQKGVLAGAEEDQDRFALAVIIFQLLNFGIHPFSGRPVGNDVPTDVPARIAGRYYAYGQRAHPGMRPNPSSGHEQFPADLRAAFDRALGGKAQDRPGAADWAGILAPYALKSSGRLVVCARNKEHQYFAGKQCAACARADLLSRAASQPKPVPEALRPAKQGRRLAVPLPQPLPASASTGKTNWWVMAPLVVVSAVLGLPVLLWNAIDGWLTKHVGWWSGSWRGTVILLAILVPLIALFVYPGYLLMHWARSAPHDLAQEPSRQAYTVQSGGSAWSSPVQKPVRTAETIDALLTAANHGDGVEFDRQFGEFMTRTPPRGHDEDKKAVDALAEYRQALRKATQSPEKVDDLDQYLEKAAAAAPHRAEVLSEVGFFRLMHFGNLTNHRPYEQVRAGWEATRSNYKAAIAAEPDDYSYWYGLGLVCAAMKDEAGCAEGAFAVSSYLKQRDEAANPGRPNDAPRIDRKRFNYMRLPYTEFFFAGDRKTRLATLKEHGKELAARLAAASAKAGANTQAAGSTGAH